MDVVGKYATGRHRIDASLTAGSEALSLPTFASTTLRVLPYTRTLTVRPRPTTHFQL